MDAMMLALALVPIAVGLLVAQLRGRQMMWRISILTTLVGLGGSLTLLLSGADVAFTAPILAGAGIGMETTSFGLMYAVISYLLFFVGVFTSKEYFPRNARRLNRYYSSLMVTLGATVGVFLAGDLLTLFVFFEVMSFASYLWVVQNQDVPSTVAGKSYLAFSVIGGLAMLFGLFLLQSLCGDLTITTLTEQFAPFVGGLPLTVACLFLFFGFGIKAGAFFLYDWLPVSYTAAPAPASALLSALLSKTGLYGIFILALRILPSYQPFAYFVLALGVLNMLVGGFSALCTCNLKRVLAFSSISQIGFILWGIALASLMGEHGTLAAYGTIFHIVNHSIIKMLLFSVAGVVFQNAGTLNLNALRGYGRGKPWLNVLFLVGGISVAGVPLFAGYISKTILHEAMTEYIVLRGGDAMLTLLEMLFLLAGGCTLAYMTKLYVCLFVSKPQGAVVKSGYATRGTMLLLTALALVLVALGSLPHVTFDALASYVAPFLGVHADEMIAYFTLKNLSGSLLSIAIGAFLFAADYIHHRKDEGARYCEVAGERETLEFVVYRPLITAVSFLSAVVARIFDVAADAVIAVVRRIFFQPLAIPDTFYHGEDGIPKQKRSPIHITYSLSYSLLMFGGGLLVTLIVLMVLGGLQ